MTDTYNGWYDWDTWNCVLWIGNDELLYRMARSCKTWHDFLCKCKAYPFTMEFTPDGARWEDADYSQMDELIKELNQ